MSTEKIEWINLVNVVSCIAVVFLHTNGCFWTFSTDRYWFTANIIESIFYFAVPCFFMISGATLMDYRDRYSLKTYFSKRFNKAVIPFLVWSLIGIIYKLALGDIKTSDITIRYLWDGIINAQIISMYWFFPALFGIYLTIPLLAAVSKSLRKEVFSYAAIAIFAINCCVPFVLSLTTDLTLNGDLRVQIGGYILYVIIGYLVFAYDISPRFRKLLYLLALCGLATLICGTYYLSVDAGEIVQIFKEYSNVPCVLYSAGLFTWCKYNAKHLMSCNVIKRIVNLINPYTLGIYLMQWFVFTSMIRLFDINTLSVLYRFGAPFIIIPVCILVAWIVRKLPGVRCMLP